MPNKNNRFRLNKTEVNILENFRSTGILPDEYKITSDINKNKLVDNNKDLKKRYEQSLKEITQLKNQLEVVNELKDNPVNPHIIKHSKTNQNSESTMVLVASDWHIEETVDPSTVNNLNEFNLKIAKERANNFFKKSLLMYNLLGDNFNIKKIILALLGDFINGYIHPEFVEENSLSPTQAILLCKELLISGIDYLLENTNIELFTIPCTPGNHGRTGEKSQIASAYKNSFEWLLYQDLQSYYRNEKRINFIVSNSYHVYINCYEKFMLRFHHGDWLTGPSTTTITKAINQWNKAIPAYFSINGHFHNLIEGENYVMNGSLCGYNSYAMSIKASYQKPQQAMFVINEEYGKILSAPIFVE